MEIHHLQENHSILNTFIAEIRDKKIQKDPMRFRRNIERIGEVMALEISKTLQFSSRDIATTLGVKRMEVLEDNLVICSVLRAGLPLHQGFLNYFDSAENGFISAFRNPTNNEDSFEIVTEYVASPRIEDKTLLLVDPMLATGKSLASVLSVLKKYGTPKEIHIACVIASREGVEFLANTFPKQAKLWVASLDETLDSKGYIVPGLGDAGDLAYGPKK